MTATAAFLHLQLFGAEGASDIACLLEGRSRDDEAVEAMDTVVGLGECHAEREVVDLGCELFEGRGRGIEDGGCGSECGWRAEVVLGPLARWVVISKHGG